MAIDPLNPAQRLRRTLRQQFGIADLRKANHSQLQMLRQGSVGGPQGTYGPGDLLPGGHAFQNRTVGAVPPGVSPIDVNAQGQVVPPANSSVAAAQHLYDLQHSGGSAADIQAGATSLAQMLRRRGRSRGGHVRAAATGGKPAATVGGRPQLP